ncbi:unnamed protein product [Musa hybrid cultivar]
MGAPWFSFSHPMLLLPVCPFDLSLKGVPAIVRSVKAPCTRRKRTRPITRSYTSRGIAYATGVVIRSCVDYTKR